MLLPLFKRERNGGLFMFGKMKTISLVAAALLGGAWLATSAHAQSASLYGGGPYNVGVGFGGGGGSGMDPAGGGPGPSGGIRRGHAPEAGAVGVLLHETAPVEHRRLRRR
jgi:hypothetical protein